MALLLEIFDSLCSTFVGFLRKGSEKRASRNGLTNVPLLCRLKIIKNEEKEGGWRIDEWRMEDAKREPRHSSGA